MTALFCPYYNALIVRIETENKKKIQNASFRLANLFVLGMKTRWFIDIVIVTYARSVPFVKW